MTDSSITYTITSTDPNNYNTIRTNLQTPYGGFCKILVSNLTTKATFIVLDKNDYIVINDIKYLFKDEYSDISHVGFADLLNEILLNSGVFASIDNCGRLEMQSSDEFIINDMSYNVKMVSGFYNDKLPIKSTSDGNSHTILARSVGYVMSTPILYIISNLGTKCYDNIDKNYCDRKILMKVYNSFTANYPIINSNGEFISFIPTNSLSNIEFKLVDSNLKDVRLLTPMYLSVNVNSVETNDIITQNVEQQLE